MPNRIRTKDLLLFERSPVPKKQALHSAGNFIPALTQDDNG
jgi:hypothetical protein